MTDRGAMNGRVVSLNRQSSSGAIQSDNGGRFHFEIAAVLAYDVAALSAGQVVSFEEDGGSPPKAINVSIVPPASIHYSGDRYRELRRLRYTGFEQQQNIRVYRFERFTPGEPAERFVVNTDMALFTQHGVRLQEGPTLCLYLLANALVAAPAGQAGPYSVTEQHIVEFLASRAEPIGKAGSRSYLR